MNETLKFEEIPAEVIKELQREYDVITFENYGNEFTPECRTRAAQFKMENDLLKYGIAMDPKTFQPVILENAQQINAFKVRGVFAEDKSKVDVYSVSTIFAVKSLPETIAHQTTDSDYDEFLALMKEYWDANPSFQKLSIGNVYNALES